ncbi:MAG: GntR family transcriptional regulator, partial [Burkholderiales bacterium]
MPNDVKIRPLAATHKLSRGLFEQLAEQIKSGRLAPGSRLPTEEALTRAARVSRTVVREA